MGDSPANLKLSPDEVLAARIADAIAKRRLVAEKKISDLRNGLARGTFKAGDWKLLADLAIPVEGDD